MSTTSRFFITLALLASASAARAQTPAAPPPGTELERRLLALEQDLAAQRAASEAKLRALEAQIVALKQQLESAPPAAPAAPPPPAPRAPAAKNYLNLSVDGLIAGGGSTSHDIPHLEPGGHDPHENGFTVQNVEAVLEGAVDPYLRAQVNLVFQIDDKGQTLTELEEAYATTSSLPHQLQLKAGQFFTEFGRLNPTHPHAWDFVDQALVMGRMFGPDGLRSRGLRLSWLLPTKFYSEVYLAAQSSSGETLTSFGGVPGDTVFGRTLGERPVRDPGDLLYTPRWNASFDVSETQTLVVGASAALGPNATGDGARTQIWGVDGFWKWKSPRANKGFPFVKVQGEFLGRGYDAAATTALAAARFHDRGGYLQASWGYKPGWIAGLRVDRVVGDAGEPANPAQTPRWRLSPALTWFPTEFSKLRLQYNYDNADLTGVDHSLWMQLEFLLGAHAAHKF